MYHIIPYHIILCLNIIIPSLCKNSYGIWESYSMHYEVMKIQEDCWLELFCLENIVIVNKIILFFICRNQIMKLINCAFFEASEIEFED